MHFGKYYDQDSPDPAQVRHGARCRVGQLSSSGAIERTSYDKPGRTAALSFYPPIHNRFRYVQLYASVAEWWLLFLLSYASTTIVSAAVKKTAINRPCLL